MGPGWCMSLLFASRSCLLTLKQTFVTFNQYPANRQESNFKDPNSFNPDRFLHCKDRDELESLKPFSTGRHNCIGKKIANAEMLLLLARLLWAFDPRLDDQNDQWDWGEQKTFVTWVWANDMSILPPLY